MKFRLVKIPYVQYMNYVIITGLFVGPLCIMRSHRWTCSVGIFLMGVGVILSSFAKTSIDLYLSSGLIAGKIFTYLGLKRTDF